MKNGSWELGKMSFVRTHTQPISLARSQPQTGSLRLLALCLSLTKYATTHIYYYTFKHFILPYRELFVLHAALHFCHQRGLNAHSWLWKSLFDVTTLLCQVITSIACLSCLISQLKTSKQLWRDNKKLLKKATLGILKETKGFLWHAHLTYIKSYWETFTYCFAFQKAGFTILYPCTLIWIYM